MDAVYLPTSPILLVCTVRSVVPAGRVIAEAIAGSDSVIVY